MQAERHGEAVTDRFLRPVDAPARRTSRRVMMPTRPRGFWSWRPDTFREAARAFFFRHRHLEAAVIAFVMAAGGFLALWWLIR